MARTLASYKADVATAGATSIALPGTAITSIAAGSLVVVCFRYEGGVAAATSVTDSAGGTYTIIGEVKNTGTDIVAGMAYAYNHPGGSSVTITVNLSGSRSYRMGSVGVFSGSPGELDPLDGSAATNNTLAADPSLNVTSTADGVAVMSVGFYSNATMVPTSPTAFLINPGDGTYASSFYREYTGSGSKTIAATGGTSAGACIAAAFLESPGTGGGGGSSTGAAAHYYRQMQ